MPKAGIIDGAFKLAVLGLIGFVVWQNSCNRSSDQPKVTTDTQWIGKYDSSPVTIPTPVNITLGSIPQGTPTIIYVPGQDKPDTVWKPIDTLAILKDYYGRADYDTTYLFPFDTTNKFPAGEVRVKNTVSQNRLFNQQVFLKYSYPQVTTTITRLDKRFQLYLGGNLYGGRDSAGMLPVGFTGVDLSFTAKAKNGKIAYEGGTVFLKNRPVMYKVGAKWLVSFRK